MKASSTRTLCVMVALAVALSALPAIAQDNVGQVLWSEFSEYRYRLKMSNKHSNQWSAPEIIEESDKPIVVPTLSAKQGKDMFAAWTEINGRHGRIRYRVKKGDAWEPSQELMTATSSDMAPDIMIDSSGVPWMVWSGTDEADDDIYFSRWIGNQWQPPERVNDNDELPDILPSISVDSRNRVTVTWQGYNGERYVNYSSYWTGKDWSRERVVGDVPLETGSSDPDLPDFISEGSRGSLFSGESKLIRKFVKPLTNR